MNIVVLDGMTLNPGDLDWRSLEAFGRLTVYDRTPPDRIVERAKGAQIVISNKTPLRAETLNLLPDLRYIGVLATGYDVIDTKAAAARGVVVTNVPGYGTQTVAQTVFALLLELCHHVQLHSDAVRGGEWSSSPDFSFWKTPLIELAGKTLGIVGFGRIGERAARIAEAFGMNVIAVRSNRAMPSSSDDAVRRVELNELFRVSDAVTLHCPLTLETEGMINRNSLSLMKPSAFLINTARGKLVVEQDLADALNEGIIAGAALDVLSTEPPPPDNPLLTARNCIVTPHIAWATKEARERLLATAADNVGAWLNGSPRNVVGVS
ncbi:D-2-hydroxyacid dehydrogenase [Cohnella luojiensis]|uniref:D-2-hydroxyacid dehydrogenase n=1 Tax=Cohnella luojiensis TaxID=652876 RepID=A0A4Y8M0D8_9BACL|nr:D-2-hydroxyacid dehydrogenase [Cohnella luojiensis]TFE25829.1 D-2-hydroxyacid dehydrogenase [Cohnella luojiensis]